MVSDKEEEFHIEYIGWIFIQRQNGKIGDVFLTSSFNIFAQYFYSSMFLDFVLLRIGSFVVLPIWSIY